MPPTLHVGTRKGLFRVEQGAQGWHLAGPPSLIGDPVSVILDDPRDGRIYAALALGHFGVKLRVSDDRGRTWTETAAPAFPKVEGEEKAPAVSLIWALAGGGADQPGVVWAGTAPGGLFRSDDRGASWRLVESLWNVPQRAKWFGGGYPEPGIHSILVDPRDSQRLALGISCGGVWRSDDGGESWRQGGLGLRAAFLPPDQAHDPTSQDPHHLAQCAEAPDRIWCQHHNGIFVSSDGGDHFAEITDVRPSVFGFAVAAHPHDPDTAWFVPAVKDELRIPVDGKLVVTRTRDCGRSFETLDRGLPQEPSYDLIYRHALDVSTDGRSLAMGSTTGNLWVGENGGERWTLVSGHLPPIAAVAFAAG